MIPSTLNSPFQTFWHRKTITSKNQRIHGIQLAGFTGNLRLPARQCPRIFINRGWVRELPRLCSCVVWIFGNSHTFGGPSQPAIFFATDYKIKMDEIHEEKEWITYSHSSMFATFLQHIFVLLRHVSARSPIRLLQRLWYDAMHVAPQEMCRNALIATKWCRTQDFATWFLGVLICTNP